MRVTMNGEAFEAAGAITVAELLDAVGRERRGIAVAINDEVVPRSTWSQVTLAVGDRIEVLSAAQGG